MSSDESKDSTEPSGETTDADGAGPFQFRNRPATTVTLPKDDEAEADDDVRDDLDEPAEPGGSEPEAVSSDRRPARVRTVAWVLLLVALVAVVVTFSSWRSVRNDPDRDRAELRDAALIEGAKDVETMTSMDHRDVAAGIKAWQSVSTGVLHDQLVSIGDGEQQMLADQGKIATGRVVEAALTALSDRTASLIVAVEVTVREDDETKEPAVKRNRFSADLVLVDGRWKIENLQQVAVGL